MKQCLWIHSLVQQISGDGREGRLDAAEAGGADGSALKGGCPLPRCLLAPYFISMSIHPPLHALLQLPCRPHAQSRGHTHRTASRVPWSMAACNGDMVSLPRVRSAPCSASRCRASRSLSRMASTSRVPSSRSAAPVCSPMGLPGAQHHHSSQRCWRGEAVLALALLLAQMQAQRAAFAGQCSHSRNRAQVQAAAESHSAPGVSRRTPKRRVEPKPTNP